MSNALINRRSALSIGGLGLLLAGCSSASPAATTSAATTSTWSFTDDRGKRAKIAGLPRHIVAYTGSAAALHDFGITSQVTGVFGPDDLAGKASVHKLPSLGTAYGDFNVEKYASLSPQLLVTNIYEDNELWYVPSNSAGQIAQLAPEVGIKTADVSLPEPIQRYASLAAALGADLSSDTVQAARLAFTGAAADLRSAAKSRPGIRVMAASASTDLLYVSAPAAYADLSYYRKLGVDMIVPSHVTGGFFADLSWENAGEYPADVILLDSRTAALQPSQLKSNPAWTALPAVKAGQIVPWLSEPRFSYQGCTTPMGALAKALRAARKVA